MTVIMVMGVSSCGKSAVGTALALRLNLPFFDGDNFHTAASRAKMASGQPLDDADRLPWLEHLAQLAADHPQAVIACSALRRAYRQLLGSRAESSPVFVWLAIERSLALQRLNSRTDHFFNPSLIDSQLDALEEPAADEGIRFVTHSCQQHDTVEGVVEIVVMALRSYGM